MENFKTPYIGDICLLNFIYKQDESAALEQQAQFAFELTKKLEQEDILFFDFFPSVSSLIIVLSSEKTDLGIIFHLQSVWEQAILSSFQKTLPLAIVVSINIGRIDQTMAHQYSIISQATNIASLVRERLLTEDAWNRKFINENAYSILFENYCSRYDLIWLTPDELIVSKQIRKV